MLKVGWLFKASPKQFCHNFPRAASSHNNQRLLQLLLFRFSSVLICIVTENLQLITSVHIKYDSSKSGNFYLRTRKWTRKTAKSDEKWPHVFLRFLHLYWPETCFGTKKSKKKFFLIVLSKKKVFFWKIFSRFRNKL